MPFQVDNLEIINVASSTNRDKSRGILRKGSYASIIWVIKGGSVILLEGEEKWVGEKEMYLIPPRKKHKIQLAPKIPGQQIILRFSYSGNFPQFRWGSYKVGDFPQFGLKMQQVLMEKRFKEKFYEERQRAILADLLIGLYRLGEPKKRSPSTKMLSAGIAAAVNYIHFNYNKHFDLRNLAKETNISSTYFYIKFKRETGVSPKQYLMQLKLKRAKDWLLESKLNVSQIAEKCGYPDIYDFSRHFKRELGLSPLEFRKGARI